MPELKIYRCFKDFREGELWAKYDGNQIHEILKQEFHMGKRVNEYESRQFNAIKTILWDANRIYMNVKNAVIPREFIYEKDPNKFSIDSKDVNSQNGLVYKLFRNFEKGIEKGIFIKGKNKEIEIIEQGRLENIQKFLIDTYLEEVGIDFKIVQIKENISNFIPQIINFEK
ncbi:hypothetical protein HOD29_02315 [archaeon]|jgi:hypothetical protein|nr:hypothetical protein [archaeon]